jgi:hypothetical protein
MVAQLRSTTIFFTKSTQTYDCDYDSPSSLCLVVEDKVGVFGSAFFWPAFLKSWLWGKAGCWEKLVVRI